MKFSKLETITGVADRIADLQRTKICKLRIPPRRALVAATNQRWATAEDTPTLPAEL